MLKRIVLLAANVFERPFYQNKLIADRYIIKAHLGEGSYGHSYLVFDQQSEQNKVLKALRIHKRMTRAGRRAFEFEKELLHSIQHQGFPQYFEDGIYKNIPFYTMEYIEGKNFDQLIFQEGRKYSESAAFQIVYELLELIEYLHEKKLIHRDIRIPNVIFNNSGIKLIDLGLTRRVNQFDGKLKIPQKDLRKSITPQADFYGLGHFLLFLLYSNFSFQKSKKEESWEEELEISDYAKQIIRRLLQIEDPYDCCAQIKSDIKKSIETLGGKKHVVF